MRCDDESVQEYLETEVAERGSCQLSGYLTDAAGADLTLARLNTLTVTLYDQASEAILNSRNAQSILNVNGGTVADVTVEGVQRLSFKLVLSGADHAIQDDDRGRETHVALLQWGYDGGTPGKKAISFPVVNLSLIP